MKLSYFSITNIVWSKMALYVLQNIIITPEINSPYSIPPQMWSHSWLYYFWFSSYDSGLLRKAAILDLFNMAATAGIQLGPLKKLVCYGHIYTYSKIGACRTIWTIIWLSPLTNSVRICINNITRRKTDQQLLQWRGRHLRKTKPWHNSDGKFQCASRENNKPYGNGNG